MSFKKDYRICMLTPDSQIDRRILLEACSLQQQGAKVTILAMPSDIKCALVEHEGVTIQKLNMSTKGRVSSFSGLTYHGDKLLKKLLGKSNWLRRWLRSVFWRLQKSPENYYKKLFLDEALTIKADIYVAHDLPMLPIAFACAKQYGAKLIYDSHELYTEQLFSKQEKARWQQVEKNYIPYCDKVITVNDSIAAELKERYQISNVSVILNAEKKYLSSSTETIDIRKSLNLRSDAFILLYQGSITSQHNLKVLVEAMALLKNTHPEIYLLFLGDGPYVEQLKNFIHRKHMKDNVYCLPAVPQDKLWSYTQSADVGIIPYLPDCLNNYLCTPNKLFEYIAAGLPIIATNLPELRKFIYDTQIGFVGDSSSPQAIADQLIQMTESNNFQLFKHNVMLLQTRINWEVESEKLIEIYAELENAGS